VNIKHQILRPLFYFSLHHTTCCTCLNPYQHWHASLCASAVVQHPLFCYFSIVHKLQKTPRQHKIIAVFWASSPAYSLTLYYHSIDGFDY